MKRAKSIFLASLSLLSIGLIATSVIASQKNVDVVFSYTSGDGATYYNGISDSEGDTLLSELHSLNSSKMKKSIPYDSLFNYFPQTDPGSGSNQITAFYNGVSASKSQCNKEHVWPDSHGGNLVENDLHMVRPTLKSDNSDRGNSFYVEGLNTQYDGWDPANCGNESYRGDSARIIFYCCVANSTLKLLDTNKHYTTSSNNDYRMGKLSDLLKWNLKYPVLQREKTRNEAAESIQGNRNPFIDHPEYACKIWGDYNNATKEICGRSSPTPVVDEIISVNVDIHEKHIGIGEEFTLNALVAPTSLQETTHLNWYSENDKIATVSSSGVVKGIANGVVDIVVVTDDMVFSDFCRVTVGTGNNSSSKMGCSGSVMTTSVTLSVLSFIGIGLFLIRSFIKGNRDEK